MSSDQSILSFLPLQYQQAPLRIGLDAHGGLIALASDLAKVLGYRDAANALRMLDADEHGYSEWSTAGGIQRVLYVNESGFYHLIFGSRREEAKIFRRWVTEEVLPTLRRTGTYTIPSVSPVHDQLTPQGCLPPPQPRPKDHANVSQHLIAVFTLLRDHDEWLTNREIAHRTGIAERTARFHTRYLKQVGMVESRETFPRYLYHRISDAATSNPAIYARLNEMAVITHARQAF